MRSKGHRDAKIFFILEHLLNHWQGRTGTHFLIPVKISAFQLWRENRSQLVLLLDFYFLNTAGKHNGDIVIYDQHLGIFG